MYKQNYFVLISAFLITGCEFHCNTGSDQTVKGAVVSAADAPGLTGTIIKNDIELEVSGTSITKTYLMDESHQYLDDNVAEEGQKIIAVVESDTGWVKIDGRSFLGASERVIDGNGLVVLDSEDLFAAYDENGLDADIAKLVNLTAVITQKSKDTDKYTVYFKIWDKKGNGTVSGKYKFRVE